MKLTAYIIIIAILLFSCSCNVQNDSPITADTSSQVEPTMTVIITPTTTNTPTPTETVMPTDTPFPTYDIAEIMVIQEEYYTYVRSEPNDESEIIVGAVLGVGFAIHSIEVSDNQELWYKVFYNDQFGYIKKQYVIVRPEKEPISIHTAYTVAPGPDGGLIDVKRYIKDIQIDLLFAQDDNILGYNGYGDDICMMQKGTLDKLMAAQKKFAENGFTIVIYDAYRPYSITVELAEKYKGSQYVSSLGGSVHNRGAAIDMSLLDSQGRIVQMPSPVHTLNEYSNRNSIEMFEISKWFMDYMEEVMIDSGFRSINTEWWHFNDKDYKKYKITDYVLTDLLKVVFE